MTTDLHAVLRRALRPGVSDVHLSSGEPPMIRLDGDLQRLDEAPLSREAVHGVAYGLMDEAQRRAFEEALAIDFSCTVDGVGRFRVHVFMQQRGEAVVFRTIPTSVASFAELGLPQLLETVCRGRHGLVLVTGAAGSGKSTTLAAMLDYLNRHTAGHVVTVEDPIEFAHRSHHCLVSQRELGVHTRSFPDALRAALREDPDVILIGELRDRETVQLALTAAETGHLVLSTLHAPGAAQAVDRIVDVFPAAQQAQVRLQLADTVAAVFTQTLCKAVRGGRVPALEIMVGTPAVRSLIREGKTHQIPSALQVGQKDGMQTLDMALTGLVRRSVVSPQEAQTHSRTPRLFGQAAQTGNPAAA